MRARAAEKVPEKERNQVTGADLLSLAISLEVGVEIVGSANDKGAPGFGLITTDQLARCRQHPKTNTGSRIFRRGQLHYENTDRVRQCVWPDDGQAERTLHHDEQTNLAWRHWPDGGGLRYWSLSERLFHGGSHRDGSTGN